MHRVLFQIGPFSVYSYGVCMAVSFIVCALLIRRDCLRKGIPFDVVLDCLLWVLLGGIVGSRLLYVFTAPEYFIRFPLQVFALRDGGMAFQGGLIAGVITGIFVCHRKKISFVWGADLIAPYIALGQAIGRIGCFLNGCCYGKETVSFGVVFPGESCMRIPVQLYTAAGLAVIFFFLFRYRDRRPFEGAVIIAYIVIYSLFRFFIEFLRGDNLPVMFGMTLAQIICLSMFLAGLFLFTVLYLMRGSKNE